MPFLQLPDTEINHNYNIEWDSTHFCPAAALTAEEKAVFGVVPLNELPQPDYDPLTHRCYRDGCELIDGQWYYKWAVVPLTPDEIDARYRASVPSEITNWQAKKQLLIEGVYEQVNAAISTMDVDAQVDWNHAAVFKRNYPLILQMQALLGRTDADTDAYFIAAGKLS